MTIGVAEELGWPRAGAQERGPGRGSPRGNERLSGVIAQSEVTLGAGEALCASFD